MVSLAFPRRLRLGKTVESSPVPRSFRAPHGQGLDGERPRIDRSPF